MCAQVDVGCGVAWIAIDDLFVERDGAFLFAGLLGLHRGQEAVLHVARWLQAGARKGRDGRRLRTRSLSSALEIEKQLAANRVDHGATMSERRGGFRCGPGRPQAADWSFRPRPSWRRCESRIEAAGTSSSRSTRKVRNWPRSWNV